MKKLKPVLQLMLSDIESKLPNLLIEHEAKQFNGYSLGYPVNLEKLLLCLRIAEGSDDTGIKLTFDIHAQLPGITEIESYSYLDAINEYLEDFEPQLIGFTDGSYSFALKDNSRMSTIEIFWSVTLSEPKDDCF